MIRMSAVQRALAQSVLGGSTPKLLGFDVGGTTFKPSLARLDGTVLNNFSQHNTESAQGPEHMLCRLYEVGTALLREFGSTWDDVLVVTLATPGPAIDGVLQEMANFPPSFYGCDIRGLLEKMLRERTGREIFVVWLNDANAGGYADWFEATEGKGGFGVVQFSPGTGLGGAVTDRFGNITDGDFGCGTELGHHFVSCHLARFAHRRCGCGKFGCREAVASLQGIELALQELLPLPLYAGHELNRMEGSWRDKALRVRRLAEQRDPLATQIILVDQAQVLADAFVSASETFDAKEGRLAGGLIDTEQWFRDLLLEQIRHYYSLWVPFAIQQKNFVIKASTFGEQAQAVGAVLYGRQILRQEGLLAA